MASGCRGGAPSCSNSNSCFYNTFYSLNAFQVPYCYLYFIVVVTRACFGMWEGMVWIEGRGNQPQVSPEALQEASKG